MFSRFTKTLFFLTLCFSLPAGAEPVVTNYESGSEVRYPVVLLRGKVSKDASTVRAVNQTSMRKFKGQTINRIPLAKITLPPHHHSMRASRLLGEGRLFYHVISRVVDRRMVFKAREKEVFRKILRNQEAFTGVRVVTY